VGFNAGLLYKSNKLSVGLNWRSQFDIEYSGDLTLDTSAMAGLPAVFQPPTSDAGTTTFKFPNILGLGVAYNATEKLLLSVDFHYVTWSRFDKYVVNLEKLEDMVVPQKFDDSFLVRGGVQYSFSPKFALRGGIVYDQTPQPDATADPLLPDADRMALTGGFGWKLAGNLVLDVAFQYEPFEDRTVPNRYALQVGSVNYGEGTYETTALLFGLSLSYAF
jgi:long-chain fatty acid transport protein